MKYLYVLTYTLNLYKIGIFEKISTIPVKWYQYYIFLRKEIENILKGKWRMIRVWRVELVDGGGVNSKDLKETTFEIICV